MIDYFATLIGRVSFAAIAGIGFGLVFKSTLVALGVTMICTSFPECLGLDGISTGPDYAGLADELDAIANSAPDDEVLS